MKNFMKNRKKIILSLLLIVIALGTIGYNYCNSLGMAIDPNNNEEIIVTIPKGSSTSKIAQILKDKNLIRNEFFFKYSARKNKLDGKFKAGDYKLNKTLNQDQIIEKLVNGEVYVETVKFTIPEGFEFRQIVDKLSSIEELNLDKQKLIEIAENDDFDYKFLENIPKGKNRLEGFLFPDTYEVKKEITEREVIEIMLNRFDSIFKDEYYLKAEDLGMSVKEVITLASIIEREAMVDKERPLVSSVFHNRLNKDRLLQSCATIQYVLGERKQNLTYDDLEIDSPYNTYKHKGLPPMPIASPGEASIQAALYPADTEYLYFVAKGDGTHAFSRTYNEHLEAKNNY